MELIKTFWHVLVLGFCLTYFGILGKATAFVANEAMNAHQVGLVSLGKLTRALFVSGFRNGRE